MAVHCHHGNAVSIQNLFLLITTVTKFKNVENSKIISLRLHEPDCAKKNFRAIHQGNR
jgi:hypothetical protein